MTSWTKIPITILHRTQRILDFKIYSNPHFKSDAGLGRVAMISLLLGSALTGHAFILGILYMHQYGLIRIDLLSHLDDQRFRLVIFWLWYTVCICFFHIAEFFVTAFYNPSSLSASSFLINHSVAYTVAYLLSFLESGLRLILFPNFSIFYIFQYVGIVLVVLGQSIRTTSMITCGDNFNHYIQSSPSASHKLVTWGIYRYLRHPSYVGFFYWCIGMQLMLGNILCSILFTIAARTFFHQRIAFEERLLLQHYPQEYSHYRKTTMLGIP